MCMMDNGNDPPAYIQISDALYKEKIINLWHPLTPAAHCLLQHVQQFQCIHHYHNIVQHF